jgi:hypothetical protein
MNKKTIGAITGAISLSIIASVGLGTYALSVSSKEKDDNTIKPLNRGKDYEHVSIGEHIDKTKVQNSFTSYKKEHCIFDETKFKHNIESLIRNAISKIGRFTNQVNNFQIDLSYQFTSNQTVAIDVV